MKTLATRIEVLERRVIANAPALCAACGNPADLRLGWLRKPEFSVVFGNEDDDGPECCPGCGRRRVFIIQLDKGG